MIASFRVWLPPPVFYITWCKSLPGRWDSLYDSSRTSLGNRKGGGSHPLCSLTTSVIRTVGDTFAYLPSPCERLMWGWKPPPIMLRTFFVRYNWRNFRLSPSPFVWCAPLVGVHGGWLPPPGYSYNIFIVPSDISLLSFLSLILCSFLRLILLSYTLS